LGIRKSGIHHLSLWRARSVDQARCASRSRMEFVKLEPQLSEPT
jgi:hypothetical protein